MTPSASTPASIKAIRSPQTGLPPHSIAAEEAVIAALLLDDAAIEAVRPVVRSDDFFRDQNAWTFAACLALAERGEPITIPTVADELHRAGRLDDAGGEPYLVEIAGRYFTAVGVEAHARIIARDALYRRTISAAGQIASLAYEGSPDPAAVLDAMEAIITGLRADSPPGSPGTRRQTLTWRTGAEIEALVPHEPEWIAKPYVAAGAITELSAKIKTGKTTFIAAMVRAVVSGEQFLGRRTRCTPVVVLTEERDATFRASMARVALVGHPDVHVLFRAEAIGMTWAAIVEAARAKASEVGARLLVIDTLGDWAGIAGDDENSAGAALAAMRPVQLAAADGLAVVVARHDRKSGGEVGDSARGSSAFGGAADVLISLRRADGQGHPERRVLHAVGRFDGIPGELVIDFEEGRYHARGEESAVELREAKAAILRHVNDTPMTEADIINESNLSRGTFIRARDVLIEEREIVRVTGLGKTGRAYGYRRANQLIDLGEGNDQSITSDGDQGESTDQPSLLDGQILCAWCEEFIADGGLDGDGEPWCSRCRDTEAAVQGEAVRS